MGHRLAGIMVLLLSLFFSAAQAQNRFYHVYFDTDNSTTTGCSVNLPDFATSIEGAERRLTITTDSALPPTITATQLHQCTGGVFDTGSNISMAALGLNTGINGTDVFEASIDQTQLGITRSGAVLLYFHTQSDNASDIVLDNGNGSPIVLGFTFPVPALGLMALTLLLALLLFTSRKQLSKRMTVSMVCICLVSSAWAMNIIIDGQTSDWSTISPANTDPVGDTSNSGSYADLTAVFVTKANETIFARMDVVDVENQAPVANTNSDTTFEDTAVTITLTGSDAEGSPITFSSGTSPANGTLSNFNVINATTSTVLYTPNADFNGADSFTVVANDGQVNSAPATIEVTVNAVNDAPSFTSGGTVNVLKTSGPYNAIWATNIVAGPNDESTQNLTFNVLNNDNQAIFDVQPAINASGVLTFTGTPDVSGTANITVNLTDDGGTANGGIDTSANVVFTINLQGVNDEPSFTAGANQTINEDNGLVTVPAWATNISAGPPDEAGQTLTFNITANDNGALFSAGPAVAADGTLTYTPAADANGVANITLELMDDGGTANGGDDTSPPQNFSITVTAVNDAPSFTAGPDQGLLEGAGAQIVNAWATAISSGPADEAGQSLNFNVSNDNNALFDVQPSISPTGTLSYTPNISALGSATVSVTLSDNGGTANGGVDTSAIQTFIISITAVNDEPSFTVGPDQAVNEDVGAVTVPGWATNILAGPPDEAGQNLTFNITGNDNATLFSAGPAVAADGTLTYTPAADANGVANITLELMDDGGTANGGDDTSPPQSFVITVTAVNDAPSFTTGADQSLLEESGAQTINGWATAISPGPTDESGQTVSFNVTNDNNSLFSTQPAIDGSGNLSYTPAANTSGTAVVSVTAVDNGGTANGGVDTSATQTFNITVTSVNDAPSFTAGPTPQTVDEDSGVQSIAWASAISAGPPDESGQNLTFILSQNSIESTLSFTSAPAISATGVLSYTAAANAYGTVSYDVTLMDDGGTANGGIDTSASVPLTITINPLNDPPAAGALGPYTATTNISVSYAAGTGLLAGIVDDATEAADPNGPAAPGTNLTIGNGGNPAPTTTVNGGDVAINTSTGAFTYDPPPGFTGTDSFDVVVCDDGIGLPASACSSAITVNITVSGNTVWFIDNTAGAGGDGRLSSPFQSIAEFEASTDPGINDYIFFYSGSGDYDGTLNLANGQTVFGQGTTSTNFNAFTGLTPVANSAPTPSLGGSRPQLISSTGNAINLAANNTLRGFNIGDTIDTDINTPNNTGNLSISEMSLLGNGRALNLANGGTLNVSLDQLVSNSGANGVYLSTVGGALSVTGGTTIDASTTNGIYILNLATGSNYNFGNTDVNNSSFNGIQIYADPGATVTFNELNVIFPGNFGFFQFGGNININSGSIAGGMATLLSLENTTANVNLDSVSGPFDNSIGIDLANNTGVINIVDGFMSSGVAGTGIEIGGLTDGSGGSAVITYGGVIDIVGPTGRSVLIQELTGGSVTLNGNIFDNGTGIRILNNNNGAPVQINFTGDITSNTATDTAILMDNNPDATMNFDGHLVLGTTTADTFKAINGGVLNVLGGSGGSTLNSTAASALWVQDVTIGSNLLSFRSVSAGSAVSSPGVGIYLDNTGNTGHVSIGGFNPITPGSGGVIQNKTGADGSNTSGNGIYLNNTSNVWLYGLQLTNFSNFAIKGNNVNGFYMSDSSINGTSGNSAANDEGAVSLYNPTGLVEFRGNTISGGFEDNIKIVNDTGTANVFVTDSINFPAIIGLNDIASGNDGILIESQMSAVANVTVDGVEFVGARGDLIQTNALDTATQTILIQNNTMNNTHPNSLGGGITVSGGGAGANLNVGYDILNNNIINAISNAITVNYVSGSGIVNGSITNNTIGSPGVPDSGSAQGAGILVGAAQNVVHTTSIVNNQLSQIVGTLGAMEVVANVENTFSAIIDGNSVSFSNNPMGFGFSAFYAILGGGTGTEAGTACINMNNNTFDASAAPSSTNAIFFDQISTSANYNFPGYIGSPNGEFAAPAGTASADLNTYLNGKGNTGVNGPIPTFPGSTDASIISGATGLGVTCN